MEYFTQIIFSIGIGTTLAVLLYTFYINHEREKSTRKLIIDQEQQMFDRVMSMMHLEMITPIDPGRVLHRTDADEAEVAKIKERLEADKQQRGR